MPRREGKATDMDEIITLAQGGGGTQTAALINNVFRSAFENPLLTGDDAAVLPAQGRFAYTTDGFVITPRVFPGGDIGRLSVCGTVNDLACMGARPKYIACSFIIEEGLPVAELRRFAGSMAATAKEAGAVIVAGDTKVVAKGQCDGVFITTSGIGEIVAGASPSGAGVRPGDAVIVTGDVGRHGAAVLVARGGFLLDAAVESDCAPLWGSVDALLRQGPMILHCARDATRGGFATVLNEVAEQSGVTVEIDEAVVPVDPQVRGVCGLLGLDPLYLACEGRLVLFVPQAEAGRALEVLRGCPYSVGAAVVGRVTAKRRAAVFARTAIGGERLLAPATGELLPRIC